MKWSHKNFFKGIVTTIVGLLLIALGLYLIFEAIRTNSWENIETAVMQGLAVIGAGTYLLGVKDPKIPGKPPVTIVLVAMVAGLSSCVTARKCYDKFGADTVQVTVRDTIIDTVAIRLPADSVRASIRDTTLWQLLEGKIESLNYESESKDLQLKLWRNKYSRALEVSSRKKSDTVVVIRKVPVEVKADCPPIVVLEPEQALRWYEKVWKRFQFFSAFLVLAGLLLLTIRHWPSITKIIKSCLGNFF